MNTNTNNEIHRRPVLSFFHPNSKGTGCAVKMELHPAHDDHSGCIMLKAANQIAIGDRRIPGKEFARFDWKNAIIVKLDFNDLCRMLQVFRGECESIGDGKGIYHRTEKASTRISLRHLLEPVSGYALELYRTQNSGEDVHAYILFGAHEALGLNDAISGSMSLVCFGIPQIFGRDSYADASERLESGNECGR